MFTVVNSLRSKLIGYFVNRTSELYTVEFYEVIPVILKNLSGSNELHYNIHVPEHSNKFPLLEESPCTKRSNAFQKIYDKSYEKIN